MSTIFVFVAVWSLLLLVLLAVDYLANPNRGRFRPLGDLRRRNRKRRAADAEHRRDLEDVAVRSVLRDRYGRSSLRFGWNEEREASALVTDDEILTGGVASPTREADEANGDAVRAGVAEEQVAPVEDDVERSGDAPDPTSVRSRVWKKHAAAGAWDDANRERLADGRAPRRRNPLNGRIERAAVDVGSGTASWPGDAVDPYAEEAAS